MFDFICGRLATRKPSYVVVEAHGVGYRIQIPLSTFERLPESGTVKLFTCLRVGEDAHRLYGFATERERDTFLRLVESVNGLGPARALAILSNVGLDDLQKAIEEGDAATVKRVKGIGDKLANRLIVELRGKLPREMPAGKDAEAASLEGDARQALITLGYSPVEADRAVGRALRELGPGTRVEDLIRGSLKYV